MSSTFFITIIFRNDIINVTEIKNSLQNDKI